MSENLPTNGFVMVPGWLMARNPPANAVIAYICLGLRGTFNPGEASYAEITPSMETLAADMRVSEPTARRAVNDLELVGGVTKTNRRRGNRQTSNSYVIHFGRVAPPEPVSAGQGQPINPEPIRHERVSSQPVTGEGLTGDRQTIGLSPSLRSGDSTSTDPEPETTTDSLRSSAQTIIGDWIDWRGARPPGRVVGQVAKLVGEMLNEGIERDAIVKGIGQMELRRLHPSTLPSLVAEQQPTNGAQVVQIAPGVSGHQGIGFSAGASRTGTGTTAQRVGAALALAEEYRRQGL